MWPSLETTAAAATAFPDRYARSKSTMPIVGWILMRRTKKNEKETMSKIVEF